MAKQLEGRHPVVKGIFQWLACGLTSLAIILLASDFSVSEAQAQPAPGGPPGLCLWRVPGTQTYINLYHVSLVDVGPAIGFDQAVLIKGTDIYQQVDLRKHGPATQVLSSIQMRLKECSQYKY